MMMTTSLSRAVQQTWRRGPRGRRQQGRQSAVGGRQQRRRISSSRGVHRSVWQERARTCCVVRAWRRGRVVAALLLVKSILRL